MTTTKNPNIPAYQRKRSLAAKARKKTTTKPRRVTRPRPATFEKTISALEPTAPSLREMKTCGHCDGFFDQIDVAVIKLTGTIKIGDIIIFEKDRGLFEQEISSMQINKQDVAVAYTGDDIGLKVRMKPKVGTSVYKII